MRRHWSFVVCDRKYLYPFVALLLAAGVWAAWVFKNPVHFNRVGNFIIAVGVWMSMRHTLREGIKKHKDLADSSPVIPGTNQLNAQWVNQITFSIGDARLQLHGFILVIVGSLVGSFGDLALKSGFPERF